MLDINFIRKNLDKIKKDIEDRKANLDLDELIKLDKGRRAFIGLADKLRSKRNEAARNRDKEEGARVKSQLKDLETKLTKTEKRWQELMLWVPNILLDIVPRGDVSASKVIRKVGELPKFSFKPKDHIELGTLLDIFDFKRGVKVGGFRGYYLKNEGAKLHWAVLNFALDHLTQKGFQAVVPPVINRTFALAGGGQFPWGEEDTYKLGNDEFLVGTAEIPLMAMHADETFNLQDLPKKYLALSPCFRTEIGSYGKDTRGLYRVHEFYKVEQVVLCEADEKETLGYFEDLQDNAETLLELLGLPYRVIILSSQDMGKKASLTYDTETWMPGRGAYGETHSNSMVLDFQTRRLKIRYRDEKGSIKFCYALNNTAIASPRILIAILENFQEEDGSVRIPEVLQKYTNFSRVSPG